MEAWSAGKLCPLCGPLLYPDWPRCTCSLVGCTLIVLWFDVCSQQHHSCTTFNRPLRNKIILHATSYTCCNLSESSQPCNLIDLISTPFHNCALNRTYTLPQSLRIYLLFSVDTPEQRLHYGIRSSNHQTPTSRQERIRPSTDIKASRKSTCATRGG